jgi:hypothetical protein
MAILSNWDAVRAVESKELRSMTPSARLKTLTQLMNWAREMGWETKIRKSNRDKWEAWAALKRKLDATKKTPARGSPASSHPQKSRGVAA